MGQHVQVQFFVVVGEEVVAYLEPVGLLLLLIALSKLG